MKRWALIKLNRVDLVVEQEDLPTVFTEAGAFWVDITGQHVGPNYKYVDGEFSPPDPAPVIRTRLEMINLLGADYFTIVSTAKTDVEVEIWLEKFRLTESFNMSDSSTQTDIQFLVTKNLLTEQRVQEILNAPVLESERA